MPAIATDLAESMQWTRSFVGTLLVATVTSLPDLALTLSALRLGAVLPVPAVSAKSTSADERGGHGRDAAQAQQKRAALGASWASLAIGGVHALSACVLLRHGA